MSPSTAHRTLRSLEERLVKSIGKMRCLTDFGLGVAEDLLNTSLPRAGGATLRIADT
ncbi:MAG: hypothetical protein ACLTQI_03430 [Slackia sp.]